MTTILATQTDPESRDAVRPQRIHIEECENFSTWDRLKKHTSNIVSALNKLQKKPLKALSFIEKGTRDPYEISKAAQNLLYKQAQSEITEEEVHKWKLGPDALGL